MLKNEGGTPKLREGPYISRRVHILENPVPKGYFMGGRSRAWLSVFNVQYLRNIQHVQQRVGALGTAPEQWEHLENIFEIKSCPKQNQNKDYEEDN